MINCKSYIKDTTFNLQYRPIALNKQDRYGLSDVQDVNKYKYEESIRYDFLMWAAHYISGNGILICYIYSSIIEDNI